MHQYTLPNPATMVLSPSALTTISQSGCINIKLPPIRHVTPEQRTDCSWSDTTRASDASRCSSASSIASPGFHPSRHASSAFSNSPRQRQYEISGSLNPWCLQTGHVQTSPRTKPLHGSVTVTSHTGGKASTTKREDRKQFSKREDRKKFSKRVLAGASSFRVRKSDSEAGNRYCQALDQADLSRVCREANPNIESTAAPRHCSKGSWVLLKNNNISGDVRQDGIEPSKWNKSSVNGSAILIIEHSNNLLDDTISHCGSLEVRCKSMSVEQIAEELAWFKQCLTEARNTRGGAGWEVATKRMADRQNKMKVASLVSADVAPNCSP